MLYCVFVPLQIIIAVGVAGRADQPAVLVDILR
jgi:hypothetical protein